MPVEKNLLTVLLPHKERPEYTLRWLEYAEETKFPFTVIIADGSDDSNIEQALLSPRESYPDIDLVYMRYPYDASYSEYYTKMVSVISTITTPFLALVDNDILPVVEGLKKSVHFLDENEDYSTCRGQHLDFIFDTDNREGSLLCGDRMRIHSLYFDKRHTIWRSFEDDDPLVRIEQWSHCINIVYYNVHRTGNLVEAWRFIQEQDCADIFITDLAIALFALAVGKTHVFDYPYMMRQQNSPNSISKAAIKSDDILSRMFAEKWTVDINSLAEAIAERAAAVSDHSHNEAICAVMTALKNHYADRLYKHLKRRDSEKQSHEYGIPDITDPTYLDISSLDDLGDGFGFIFNFLINKESELRKT